MSNVCVADAAFQIKTAVYVHVLAFLRVCGTLGSICSNASSVSTHPLSIKLHAPRQVVLVLCCLIHHITHSQGVRMHRRHAYCDLLMQYDILIVSKGVDPAAVTSQLLCAAH
jgi:hypothetical protein